MQPRPLNVTSEARSAVADPVTLARWHASALTETDEEEANLW